MPAITKVQAVQLLAAAAEKASPDDLAEIYNELFPEEPTTEKEAVTAAQGLAAQVVEHISNGLEVEEIVDLWPVVFPGCHDVRFDEEEGLLHYDEDRLPVAQGE
jgi:hypothetical protein